VLHQARGNGIVRQFFARGFPAFVAALVVIASAGAGSSATAGTYMRTGATVESGRTAGGNVFTTYPSVTGVDAADVPGAGEAPMAKARRLWVILTTANVTDADTDDKFDLVIDGVSPNPNFAWRFHFPDLPNPDERERARTDEYRFTVESINTQLEFIQGRDIVIQTLGRDAWLPSSIWVIGEDVQGARRLIAGFPSWPSNRWWSNDSSEGEASRRLG
jgi:hypothetical protein